MQEAPEEIACDGHCKAVVRSVMEQVRAETEQWTQMQKMLGQVRQEMEELEASRDFWEHQALHSNSQIHSLRSHVSFTKLVFIITPFLLDQKGLHSINEKKHLTSLVLLFSLLAKRMEAQSWDF